MIAESLGKKPRPFMPHIDDQNSIYMDWLKAFLTSGKKRIAKI